MARTLEGARLTEVHRQGQARIAAALVRDLTRLWRSFDVENLRATLDPVVSGAVAVVQSRRVSSALAAQGYYSVFREAEGEGPIEVATPPPPPSEEVRGLLVGASLVGVRNARLRGLSSGDVALSALSLVVGSGRRLVAQGGRETILRAILEDEKAVGYQRVTDANPCAFCAMLAGRGIVGYDATSAGFQAHGHCGCTAEPAFEGSEVSPRNATFREQWDEVTTGLSGGEALTAFRAHVSRLSKLPATG